MPAVRMIITGQVQGVFFRAETQAKAKELTLTGWVRNNADGSLEVHAEGEPEALAQLQAWCHRGPPRANVKKVIVAQAEEQGLATFEIR
ncbi:acylphosphatase [Candidatus Peregrinibacteria bacterium]|nr:acylphosphatase [Candidatus Peregrinibacteria bacterium]